MTAGLAPWLALRYPFDEAARSELITRHLSALCPKKKPLRVLDLGAGTGANFRYLASRLGCDQDWLLVDQSADLLAQAHKEIRHMAVAQSWQVKTRGDTSLVASGAYSWAARTKVLDMAEDILSLDFGAFDLVTASALTDLVSRRWFLALVEACWDARAVVAVTLTYDGRMIWDPPAADDAIVLDWFNRHQRANKGFGPAMGPDAADPTVEVERAAGYSVVRDRSDWHIQPADGDMHDAMIRWVDLATVEFMPPETGRIRTWAATRRRLAASGTCSLTVGHLDTLAFPPDRNC